MARITIKTLQAELDAVNAAFAHAHALLAAATAERDALAAQVAALESQLAGHCDGVQRSSRAAYTAPAWQGERAAQMAAAKALAMATGRVARAY